MWKSCAECGNDFQTSRKDAKFCSMSCFQENRKVEKVLTECKTCGREFEIYIKEYERGRGKYCSRECQHSSNHDFCTPDILTADEFKNQRKYLGLSSSNLANLWGVSSSWIRMIEQGEREAKRWMSLAFRSLRNQKNISGDNDACTT